MAGRSLFYEAQCLAAEIAHAGDGSGGVREHPHLMNATNARENEQVWIIFFALRHAAGRCVISGG
jgi:hypothetical protein